MKSKLILVVTLISTLATAHEGVELGPNGGRIIEFSKNETRHGEVTVKSSNFHIAVLDKDMKPVAMDKQSLAATTGDRRAPVKLIINQDSKGFIVPLVKAGDWLILQYKETPDAKTITARFEYNTEICDGCQKAEWLCECQPGITNK